MVLAADREVGNDRRSCYVRGNHHFVVGFATDPDRNGHARICVSLPPVTSRFPSGEIVKQCVENSAPTSPSSWPLARSHNRTRPPCVCTASTRPSSENRAVLLSSTSFALKRWTKSLRSKSHRPKLY